ncbi:MAG: hypothetical protein ACR2NM_12050 [Bythopirellula sp.]
MFYVPYQVRGSRKLLDPVAKVQLLMSRTGANDWRTLQEAKPGVQGFSFHAPEDGEFWFALRHLDRRGRPWPNATVQPQMRIVVDTEKPTLTLAGTASTSGDVIVRYEARDENLDATTLTIESRAAGAPWSPLTLETPDIAQPNRLVGRARRRPAAKSEPVELRASIADRAGQRVSASATVAPVAIHGPALRNPFVGANHKGQQATAGQSVPQAITNPFATASQLPAQDWPATNELPQTLPQQAPPSSNPYTAAGQASTNRTPAKLVGDRPLNSGLSHPVSDGPQTLRLTPLPPIDQPENSASHQPLQPQRSPASNDWQAARPPAESTSRVVNSKTFDIEYDLQSVGPWGVSKIELWGTHDDGRTWRSFGVDSDSRSPFRVTVPTAGTYGFRILVDGANSAGSPPPQAGDTAELTVSIDLQPPTAELLDANLGEGNLSDHLLVSWTASDTNLEPRPIALFYSSYPNGPWSTIASGLENTGSYTWRIERHVPERFYLRLEARDTAGNLATFQTPAPIELPRPQPSGRLRSVRPITSDGHR